MEKNEETTKNAVPTADGSDWGDWDSAVDITQGISMSSAIKTGMKEKGQEQEEEEEKTQQEKKQDFNSDDFSDEVEEQEEEEEKEEAPTKEKEEEQEEEQEEEEEEEGEEEESEKDESEEEEEEEEESEVSKEDAYAALLEDLKNGGVLPEGVDDTTDPQELVRAFDQEVNKRTDEALSEFVAELDDDAKAFLKYKKDVGGSTSSFMEVYGEKTPSDFPDTEEGKADRLRYWMTTHDGLDPADVETTIQGWIDLDLIEKMDSVYSKRWDNMIATRKEEFMKKQEQAIEHAKRKTQELKIKLQTAAKSKELADKYGFSKEDIRTLPSMLVEASVKQDGKVMTPFGAKLKEILEGDPEKSLLLAKLLKNDLDLSFLERKITTKVSKDSKKGRLSKIKGKKTRKEPPSSKPKGAWEYF